MNDAQSILRIARLFGKVPRVSEAKLSSENTEVIKPLDGLRVGHG